MPAVCVFCSSSNAINQNYFTASEKVLLPFVTAKYDLVYGGSDLGLMGATARLFNKYGCKVTGILPKKIFHAVGNPDFVEECHVVETMHERKQKMRDLASVFIALPGGFGTFEEILEVITLKQLGYLDVPVIIANIDGFYDHLVAAFEKIFTDFFAKDEYRDLYLISDDPDEIFTYVKNYTAFGNRTKW